MTLKAAPGSIGTHLELETMRLATCWRIDRQDGETFGFTDHDKEFTVGGVVYEPTAGFTGSAVSAKSDLSVDELEVQAILNSDSITEADLVAGLWDHAEVRVFYVDWANPTAGALKMRRGWLGTVSTGRSQFQAELHGLLAKAQQNVGRQYDAACDADLGDARCGVDLDALAVAGTVTSSANRASFIATGLINDIPNYYENGVVTWATGENAGLRMEVRNSTGGTGDIALFLPMPFNIEAGDTFTITPGCNKSIQHCVGKFDNVVNFRGFPHIPTTDSQQAGPDSTGTITGRSYNPPGSTDGSADPGDGEGAGPPVTPPLDNDGVGLGQSGAWIDILKDSMLRASDILVLAGGGTVPMPSPNQRFASTAGIRQAMLDGIGSLGFANRMKSICPWAWTYAAQGHSATNTVLEFRRMFAQIKRVSINDWRFMFRGGRCKGEARVENSALNGQGHQWDYTGEISRCKPYGNVGYEMWAMPSSTNPEVQEFHGLIDGSALQDMINVCVGIQVRVARENPNLPADPAGAIRLIATIGYDIFDPDTVTSARYTPGGYPNHAIDCAGARWRYIRTDGEWQWITCTGGDWSDQFEALDQYPYPWRTDYDPSNPYNNSPTFGESLATVEAAPPIDMLVYYGDA